MTLLLGIDIGTSSAKAILFDVNQGKAVATSRGHEYPVHKPAPNQAIQHPQDWWQAVVNAIQDVLKQIGQAGNEAIAAIGVTGQMHGTILLDDAGNAIHPAIIWADGRSAEAAETLLKTIGRERYVAITGTLPAAGFMGSTFTWLKNHQPALLEQATHIVLPKDTIVQHLTGEIVTDITDAAATGLFDVRTGTWSDDIINTMGFPREKFVQVYSSTTVIGQVTEAAATETGLAAGIPVVAGCADQPAVAIANGIIRPGIASITTGSGGQVFVPIQPGDNPLSTDPRLHVFNHAVSGMFYALGATLSAGLSLRWLRDLTGLKDQPGAYALLSEEASQIPAGADGLLFLPYLSGERTPHMDAHARGLFMGLSAHHTRAHLARAVMEGVTFSLREALEITRTMGVETDSLIIAGGAAESAVWRQIQADIFAVSLQRSQQSEAACTGAALLAGIGAGVYASFEEACATLPVSTQQITPDPAQHERYNRLYQHYVSLYPLLKDTMHSLSAPD